MRTPARFALFGAKKLRFFEIYGVSTRTKGRRGLDQCGHFSDKGESIFSDFVRTSFMDGP